MAKILKRNFSYKKNNFITKNQKKNKKNITKRRINVQDARQKLIQKKRSKLIDARDILAKMAKTQDARNKLNKLRQSRGIPSPGVKIIGANILQKVDKNGKISLLTNKTKNELNMVIQKELGLTPTVPKKILPRRSIQKGVVRQPVMNEIVYNTDDIVANYNPTVYKWAKPNTASQLIGSLSVKNPIEWQNFPITKSIRIPQNYIDLDAVDDEEMPLASPIKQTISIKGSSRLSNVHSRLDNIPVQQETHGILGQPKTKVVVPAGHRIVVSNLQSTVTQDDVKELFEDIGQLLAARLVRPGVAEVIYKNLKDAQNAVDTYHNRQLDGQPMKCLLVNKRPFNNPTAPAIGKLNQGIMKNINDYPSNEISNKLTPDVSTIHKVLFQRK